MSTITHATPTIDRYTDDVAHRHAAEHVAVTLGLDVEPSIIWDERHHLQGHLQVAGQHLVVIAPRTGEHDPRLLTEQEWDGLRHGVAA